VGRGAPDARPRRSARSAVVGLQPESACPGWAGSSRSNLARRSRRDARQPVHQGAGSGSSTCSPREARFGARRGGRQGERGLSRFWCRPFGRGTNSSRALPVTRNRIGAPSHRAVRRAEIARGAVRGTRQSARPAPPRNVGEGKCRAAFAGRRRRVWRCGNWLAPGRLPARVTGCHPSTRWRPCSGVSRGTLRSALGRLEGERRDHPPSGGAGHSWAG